jgi:medium-chain acyl-[acyl-carrier-protein] hydrolase
MADGYDNAWVQRVRANSRADLRLFCLPFAGGSADVYSTWPGELPASIEVCSINLPGRGRRYTEPLCDQLVPLVERIAAGIVPFLDRPFALFGHSMGALLAFELAHVLSARAHVQPIHLFVSGAAAPQLPSPHQFHTLPDAQFLAAVQNLSGMSAEVAANDELMALFLPILRADFAVAERYSHVAAGPLGCPLSVLAGRHDPLVALDLLPLWRVHSVAGCEIDLFPGDHFFLRSCRTQLLEILASRLLAQHAS